MAVGDTKRKLTAILSADVAGYSRLMQDDEAATVETLTRYRSVVAELVDRHDGRVVDSPGDNILAEFNSPVEAAECAVETQRELARRNRQLAPHRRMTFRVGLNLGDVIARDDGSLYGDGVNIAARLEAICEPGEIVISATVRDHIVGKVGYSFGDLGEYQVKNIEQPIHAFRLDTDASPLSGSGQRRALTGRRKIAWLGLPAAAIFGGLIAMAAMWQFVPAKDAPSERDAYADHANELALPIGPSIAVLPFENMSCDPEQDYFSDGLTEDIITELARYPELTVLARNTTFQYKNVAVDVAQVGRELGVRYVIEGSVRKAGDQLRVTAQLIDVGDGSHVWAERYDEKQSEIFALQDRLTGRIVSAVIGGDASALERSERAASLAKTPEQMVAYDFVLRARGYRAYKRDEYQSAKLMLQRAVDVDPEFARAQHELAWLMMVGWFYRFEDSPQPPEEVKERAIRSVELDPTDARARRTAAYGYFFDRQMELFELEARTAFELSPYNAEIFAQLGMPIAFTGQWERGYRLVGKAYELNPETAASWYHTTAFYYHYFEKDYARAINVLRQHPSQNIVETAMKFVPAYGQLEDIGNARNYWAKCVELEPDWSVARMRKIFELWNFTAADINELMDGLRKAGIADS